MKHHWRRFLLEEGGGGEIEGEKWGGGVLLPSRLGSLGSVVSSPSGAENGFWCILSLKEPMW